MPDNFFAMLDDGSIKRIALLQNIENSIRNVFLNYGPAMTVGKDEEEFDGNYKIEEDEVSFVTFPLPIEFNDVANNPIGIPILNLKQDRIKALFWYENNEYYFQNFDNRKMLQHKNVIYFDNQTFNRLTQDAFVIENAVNAVYISGRFYFISYSNANKIFNLFEFYEEATNDELTEFAGNENISISDSQWFLDNSNSVIRKHISLLKKSNVLDSVDTAKIKRGAKKFKLTMELDNEGKIIFPQNRRACKELLYYLNEQLYEGPITKRQFKTNSKKQINKID
jgi:hypothetical protein